MGTKIAHKRSATPGKVPFPVDLSYGELALNTADFVIYFKDSTNTVRAVNDWSNILNKPAGLVAGSISATSDTLVLRDSNGNIEANNVSVSSDLFVSGNLVISGSSSVVESTVVTVNDPIMTLAAEVPTINDGKDRGVEFRWHDGTASKLGFFGFDNSTQKFTFYTDATNTSEVFAGTKGTIDANIEWADVLNKPSPVITLGGDLAGSVTLSSVGSATLNAVIQPNSVALGTDTTGDYVATVTGSTYVIVDGTVGEGWSPQISVSADSSNTISTLVARDASGNFAANVITADLTGDVTGNLTGDVQGNVTGNLTGDVQGNVTGNLTGSVAGNAATASAWETPRTIALAGVLSGNAVVDGSANVTITASYVADSIVLGTHTTGAYAAGVTAGNYILVSGTSGEGWSPTIAVDGTSANTPSKVVIRDALGNFSVNTITGSIKDGTVSNVAISNSTIDNVVVDGGSF